MSNPNVLAKSLLEAALEALHEANRLQQKAYGLLPESATDGEDISYQIHSEIENVIEVLEEQIENIA